MQSLTAFSTEEFNTHCHTNESYQTADITDKIIEKLLGKINRNKAAGPDSIKSNVLKELSKDMSPLLKYHHSAKARPVYKKR